MKNLHTQADMVRDGLLIADKWSDRERTLRALNAAQRVAEALAADIAAEIRRRNLDHAREHGLS